VCLLAAPWVQLSVIAGNGWPHNALRHHWLMPISCHFRDHKALLVTSLTHVSGAIASVQTFTFTSRKFDRNPLSKPIRAEQTAKKMPMLSREIIGTTPFRISAPTTWNSLPQNLRDCSSTTPKHTISVLPSPLSDT